MITKILFMGRQADFCRPAQISVDAAGHRNRRRTDRQPPARLADDRRRQRLGLPLYTFDHRLGSNERRSSEIRFRLVRTLLAQTARRIPDRPALGHDRLPPALLPEYKGTGGYNLAIMDELSEWGSTAHTSIPPSTPAKIIEVDRFPIDSSVETAQSLEHKTMRALEPFAQRIIARAVRTQTKLPTTPTSAALTSAATKWKL